MPNPRMLMNITDRRVYMATADRRAVWTGASAVMGPDRTGEAWRQGREDGYGEPEKPPPGSLLRLLQPVDVPRLREPPAPGRRARRGDRLAAVPGRRGVQHR